MTDTVSAATSGKETIVTDATRAAFERGDLTADDVFDVLAEVETGRAAHAEGNAMLREELGRIAAQENDRTRPTATDMSHRLCAARGPNDETVCTLPRGHAGDHCGPVMWSTLSETLEVSTAKGGTTTTGSAT